MRERDEGMENLYKNKINALNQEINLIKEQNKKKLNALNKEAISLKNEFLNKENKIKSEKNNLVQKIENTHLKNLQLQKENDELKVKNYFYKILVLNKIPKMEKEIMI